MPVSTRSGLYWGFVCLCACIAAGGALLPSPPASPEAPRPHAVRVPDEAELFRSFEEAAAAHPLIGLISLAFVGVVAAGALIDAGMLWRVAWRRTAWRSAAAPPGGEWGLAEVLMAALLFLSVFLALDAFAPLIRRLPRGPSDVSLQVIFQFVAEIVAIAFILAPRRAGGELGRLGLSRRGRIAAIAAGVRAYVCFLPAMIGLVVLTQLAAERANIALEPQTPIGFFFVDLSWPALVFLAIFVAVIGPICEEIFFRGFAYQAIRRRWGRWPGILVTALVFSALHASASVFLPIFGLGILLAYVFEATGSLFAPITVHICQNSVAVAAVLLLRSITRP